MCGVAGIYAYHYAASPVDRNELIRIRDHMRRRGPDAEGVWESANRRVGLAHRRLAIIDLDPRSNQPMTSADGRFVITFNGEIYNYRALRLELEREGVTFRTQSDTEVLLELYRRDGERMFARLRGMYAFGLWDAVRNALMLARDPYGIKPLYYADDGWTCRFASQVKALLSGQAISRDPEPAGLVGFHLLGSVPEPYTAYQAIRSVPAGSFVWVDALGAGSARQHFSLAGTWAAAAASDVPAADAVRAALQDSVRHHLVADVPVGAFLSAGVDSGALVGLMRDAGQQSITTVTVAFDEFQGRSEDESPLAAETARNYGTRHHVRRVTKREFLADMPRIIEAMDQPSIDGINTWFVAKATAEQGLKVAISGLGGDELFGGYSSFVDVPRWVSLLGVPSLVPGSDLLFKSLAPLMFPQANPKLRDLLRYGGTYPGAWFLKRGLFMPSELTKVMDRDVVDEGLRRLQLERHLADAMEPDPGAPFARVSALESGLYMRNQLLRDTDWASMAHSFEARVPLVDPLLLRSVAGAVAAGEQPRKSLLADAPKTRLPEAVVKRPKTGFGIPVAQWIQEDPQMAAWRKIPSLARPECPWARRWSHVVAEQFATA